MRRNVTAGRRPLQAVVGRALSLNAGETDDHLTELAKLLKDFHLIDCPSRKAIGDALKTPAPELVYFYCHGRSTSRKAGEVPEPELEVGSGELITPSGLLAWGSQTDWPLDHWHDTAPLVFINGCHTVEITPAVLASFVDEFADLEAAGVIGTEISVDQHMASEAGEQFLEHFGNGRTVAESIRRMRGHFLAKGNCLGLAYTPYCSLDLCLVKQAPSPP